MRNLRALFLALLCLLLTATPAAAHGGGNHAELWMVFETPGPYYVGDTVTIRAYPTHPDGTNASLDNNGIGRVKVGWMEPDGPGSIQERLLMEPWAATDDAEHRTQNSGSSQDSYMFVDVEVDKAGQYAVLLWADTDPSALSESWHGGQIQFTAQEAEARKMALWISGLNASQLLEGAVYSLALSVALWHGWMVPAIIATMALPSPMVEAWPFGIKPFFLFYLVSLWVTWLGYGKIKPQREGPSFEEEGT